MAKKNTVKTSAKKSVGKITVKKTTAKKIAVKKTAAKKVAKKKSPAKTIPVKKAVETRIIARVDVGFGNSLYIRGEGASGLSWDRGVLLDNVNPYEWTLSTKNAKSEITFKFLINDEIWAVGDNITVAKGDTSVSSPVFAW